MNKPIEELVRAAIVAFVGEGEFGVGRTHKSGMTNDARLERLLGILNKDDSNESRDWSDAECIAWLLRRCV